MRRQEEEFLRQIRRKPDDDQLRLIFADFLDQIGDERAELIRVQCESAQGPAPAEHGAGQQLARFQRLKAHEEGLLRLWRESCLDELAPWGVRDVRFARGFVERIHLEGAAFLNRTKAIAEWAPALQGVLWQKLPRQAAEPIKRFFDSPVFSTVQTLNLMRNKLGAAGVETLAHSSGLARIQSLSLKGNPIGGHGLRELANSKHLSGLTRWDLTDTQLSAVDARNLSQAKSLLRMEELLLGHNRIGDAGLRSLANTPRLRTLRTLAIADNHIAQEGLRALADSAHLTDLRVLDLSGNDIGDAGFELMATASNYARLSELNIAGCGIEARGLMALAESPYLKRLSALDLSHTPLRKELPWLWESPLMAGLQSLSLRHCELDSQSVKPLLSQAQRLTLLDLRDNPLIPFSLQEQLAKKLGERVLF